MNAEMKSYTSGLAERIDIASEAVVQFFNCTIITAVIDRLAKEYHLDPAFWEFLSHKDDILGYLMGEVKKMTNQETTQKTKAKIQKEYKIFYYSL